MRKPRITVPFPVFLSACLILFLVAIIAIKPMSEEDNSSTQTSSPQINYVTFNCDEGKTINAIFFDDKVELALSDSRNFLLNQAISASGARYVNDDESLVFWNKGDMAFITENDTTTFENCVIPSPSPSQ